MAGDRASTGSDRRYASGREVASEAVCCLLAAESGVRLAPVGLASGDSIAGELRGTGAANTVVEGRDAAKRDVVVTPIPDGSVCHAVGAKGEGGADGGASEDIVPVVELVDGERAADEDSAKDGSVDQCQLPQGGVIVGEDLELGVEIEVQEDEAGKCCGGVTRGERLQGVVDLPLVTSADLACVVEAPEAITRLQERRVRLADVQEVGAQAADEPLDEDLEDGSRDEGVEQTEDGVVEVPEGADTDLHQGEEQDRDATGQHSSQPDGDDFLAERIGELGVDNLAVGVSDGERAIGCRRQHVDLRSSQASVSDKQTNG